MQTIGFQRRWALPRSKLVVRGTVDKVTPGEKIPHLFFFKKILLPKIRVRIDDLPYERLRQKLRRDTRLYQDPTIHWGDTDRSVPTVGTRVWVTFGYSMELESFFNNAPLLTLIDVEVIANEGETREHEFLDPQPQLSLVHT